MSKIKKKGKKKNYTLKKKRYSKRGGSSAVQPNQAVSTEIVSQNENAMESRQPNNSTENKNGNGDDVSDRGLLIFYLDVNETCPTNYKLLKKKKKSFCYKLSSKSNLIQNYNNQTPLEIDITAKEKKILDSNIESLKQDQNSLLFFKKTEEELTQKKGRGEILTKEEEINLQEGKAKRETIENTMRGKMKNIIKKEGPGALRRMTAGGLSLAVTLLLFPAMGIAAPGAGSSAFKLFDRGLKFVGNAAHKKMIRNRKKRITAKKKKILDSKFESGNNAPAFQNMTTQGQQMMQNGQQMGKQMIAQGTQQMAPMVKLGQQMGNQMMQNGQQMGNQMIAQGTQQMAPMEKRGQQMIAKVNNSFGDTEF